MTQVYEGKFRDETITVGGPLVHITHRDGNQPRTFPVQRYKAVIGNGGSSGGSGDSGFGFNATAMSPPPPQQQPHKHRVVRWRPLTLSLLSAAAAALLTAALLPPLSPPSDRVTAFSISQSPPPSPPSSSHHDPLLHLVLHERQRLQAQSHPSLWALFLQQHHQNRSVQTRRTACREFDAGAQTCVFEGFACVNVSSVVTQSDRPLIYFVDDAKRDYEPVTSDQWCSLRHQSSDPRYFSSRHWPILNHTVAPQRSCLTAQYRTFNSLLHRRLTLLQNGSLPSEAATRIKWVSSIWLSDLDYHDNNHNNHLLKDIIWMLDISLWQTSLSLSVSPVHNIPLTFSTNGLFETTPQHIYLPQSQTDFERQTARDVNRLNYALVLQKDLSHLYPNLTSSQIRQPGQHARPTQPLFKAYPELLQNDSLLFHRDLKADSQYDLVCTPRLTVGAKIGNGAHERVCRSLRQRAHQFYGVEHNQMKRLGSTFYPQPPKRIVVLQRHVTRRFANLNQLLNALRSQFGLKGIDVQLVSTKQLQTAEQFVRVFSSAGVLITPHGSQAMGQIYMPRHSAIIEVMPVGYTDYAFNLLSESCKIWYYELQSMRLPNKPAEWYEEKCGRHTPHMMSPCNDIKSVDVWVNITSAVRTIKFAFERMGYPIDPWMEYVQSGG
ncbi:Protein O-linked-mannose beta-1,4-N-acetylglucosaminyltransferase 2 [Gracilariopsis chorda]|uniref:Protein O-linked-mannose beta-1,4-N-acetylglucosaminyltransferase 2 n=1 Tax=Gracilariopsis chorda TaxID=448386 RepID=A0A2V3IKJ5_9FLOR|nr:Protein O-linked-mannose beta-1,4-N-acetylglucosaminyltransferase 2 [Gracilariopsis chorda]|eukprot:PXF42615.1 Protein O-linked-mannose beta-1,4-N-acetylglucosaminyltransferase 2 [Gracilariopsis chorda]